MKKPMILFALLAMVLSSCNDDNGNGGDPDPEPPAAIDNLVFVENGVNYLGNGDKAYPVPVGDYTLDASKQYVLRGWVYIQQGSTLTIPAGTLVKGKSTDGTITGSSLIIERGAKIIANGTPTQPIVFTSDKPAGQRKPGDWGGIILCGKARNNAFERQIEGGVRSMYGGSEDGDSSGELSYVRIEFCGYPFAPNTEINGLTMGSVGSGTKLHHIQVSYSNDDSFEWFGGAVNATHLIAYHGWDDDFDTDYGYSGRIQYALAVRHPKLGDTSNSNSFESDNNSDGSTAEPLTSVRFSNVTLVGPVGQDPAFYDVAGSGKYIDGGAMDPGNGSIVGQFQAAMHLRRNTRLSIANSVIVGWPVGTIIEGSTTQAGATANPDAIRGVVYGGYADNAPGATFDRATPNAGFVLGSPANGSFTDTLSTGVVSFAHSFILETARGNRLVADASSLLNDPRSVTSATTYNAAANYGPKAGSVLLSGFTAPVGFETAGYAGAFRSDAAADNWTSGWANFNPQNTAY